MRSNPISGGLLSSTQISQTTKPTLFSAIPFLLILVGVAPVATQFTGIGIDATALAPTVDAYKYELNNGGGTAPTAPDPVNNPDGFRSINWDAAPESVSDPNFFPGDFFNANFNRRARGMGFTTTGVGFLLSATLASGNPINFGYGPEFTTFSPERLFSPLGSNVFDVHFFNPVNPVQAALVDGFWAVFTDVELPNTTHMDYFDENNALLASIDVPELDKGLSFAGIHFDSEGSVVSRVRVYLGNFELGITEGGPIDIVVMDDFIAGEMVPIP